MIACNRHGYPPLDPYDSGGIMLDLPEFYLDLMFTDPPEEPAIDDVENEPDKLVA